MKTPEGNQDPRQLSMRDLLQQVAAETCTTPSLLTQRLLEARQRIHGLVANNQGNFEY